MAIEPIARGHYTQMQMQDKQLELARERLAQEQSQLNQRLAADRAARNQQVQHAIGMAFLNTGLDAAKTASTLGIKSAFEDPYAGYTAGALYDAARHRWGGYVAPEKKKEDKKPTGGGEKPKPVGPVEELSMSDAEFNKRIEELGGREALEGRAYHKTTIPTALVGEVPDREPEAFARQDGRAIDDPSRRKRVREAFAKRDRLDIEDSFVRPVSPLMTPEGYDALPRTASVGTAEKVQVPGPMPSAVAAEPKIQASPAPGSTAASAVSGQLAIPRSDGGKVKFTRDQRQATKKLIGVDPATQTKPVEQLQGEYKSLFKDPRVAQRNAFDRMIERVQTEAEKHFPRIRELSKEEIDDLSSNDRRMYFNALAARQELVRQRVLTMTQNLMQKEQFAKASLPTISQVSASERQATRVSQSYVPGASRKTTANAIDLVLRRGQLVKMSDVQSILAGETNQNKKDQVTARLDDADRTLIEMGGNANLEVEMSQEEANALLAFTKFYFGRKTKGVLNAGGKKFRNNDDTFLKNITFVKPAKYANSAGYNNNLWDKLEEFAGPGIGDHIRDGGPGTPSRAAQNNAQAMARELIPLYSAWKRGRVPGVKRPTIEQKMEFANSLYERGRELEKVLRAYSITRVDSPKSDESSSRKAEQSAIKQFDQLQGEYTNTLRSLATARQAYETSVRGSDRSIALGMLSKEMTDRLAKRDFKRFKENDTALPGDKRAAIERRLGELQAKVSEERSSSRGAAAEKIETYKSDLQRIYNKMKSLKSDNQEIQGDLPALPSTFQFKDRQGETRQFEIQAQVSPSDDRLLNEGLRRAQQMAAAGASQEQQNDFLVRFFRANGLSRGLMNQVERAAQSQRMV